MKTCNKCNELKPLIAFTKMAKNKDGYRNYCRVCANAQNKIYKATPEAKAKARAWEKKQRELNPNYSTIKSLMSNYGMTLEDYDAMFEAQGKACAICGATDNCRFVVDHHHGTGKVRAILCNKCNVALGLLNEDVELFKKAIEYISTDNAKM